MHRQTVVGENSETQRPETKSSSLCTRTGHGLRETETRETRTPSDRGIMSEVTNELRQNKAYAEATRCLVESNSKDPENMVQQLRKHRNQSD